jgi:hypothetical protein
VRSALSARGEPTTARPRCTPFASHAEAGALAGQHVRSGLPRRCKPDCQAPRREFLFTLRYEAARAGLDPQLVLAPDRGRERAVPPATPSPCAAARGYMQVMPFWTTLIGDGDASSNT